MSFKEEFPDFDNAESASLLIEGFALRDWSYRHDACPCLARDDIRVWVDYRARSLREIPSSAAFTVCLVRPSKQGTDEQTPIEIMSTDSLSECIKALGGLV